MCLEEVEKGGAGLMVLENASLIVDSASKLVFRHYAE